MCFPAASAVVSFTRSKSFSGTPGFWVEHIPSAALLSPCAEFGHLHICVLTITGIVVSEGWQDLRSTWVASSSLCIVRLCAESHPAKLEMMQCQSNVRCWDSPGIRDHIVVLAASLQCLLLALSCSLPFWFVHLYFSGCLWHGVPDHGSWMPFSVFVMGSSHSLQYHCLCWGQHQVPLSLNFITEKAVSLFHTVK